MATTDTASTGTHFTSAEAGRARRAGWLLITAFLTFVATVAMMILLLPEYNDALEDAARARGVTVNDLSAEVIAPIHHEYNPMSHWLVIFVVLVAALGLFITGVRAVTRIRPQGGRLPDVAVIAASAVLFIWLGIFGLEAGIGGDDPSPWLDWYDALYAPLVAASTIAGSLGVLAMTILMRRMGVARRTGLIIVGLSGLLIVVSPLSGAPPIAPLLLGAVLGIVMIRTARSVR